MHFNQSVVIIITQNLQFVILTKIFLVRKSEGHPRCQPPAGSGGEKDISCFPMNSPPEKQKTSVILTSSILIFLMAIWGYSFVGIKFLLNELSPFNLTILRFSIVVFAIIALMIIDLIRGKIWPRLRRETLWQLVGLGLIGVIGYHLSLNTGEMYTSATIASIIVFTSPIFAVLLSSKLLGEKITGQKIFGIAIAFTGAILISVFGHEEMSLSLKSVSGGLIVLGAPVSWAIYTVFGKKFSQNSPEVSPLYFSLYTMLFGSLFLIFLVRKATLTQLINLSPFGWANLLFLSLACSFLGYIVWFKALESLEAGKVTAFLYLVPVFSVLFSRLFLRESLTYLLVAGVLLIFLGVWFIESNS